MKISKFELLIYIINNIELFYMDEKFVIYRISYHINEYENTININVGYLIEVDSILAADKSHTINISDYIKYIRKIRLKKINI